jgi:UDP-glucose 4-epimerase
MPDATVVHKPGRRADVPSNVLDISLARNELGWEPRTEWITGLQLTADWIRASYPSL